MKPWLVQASCVLIAIAPMVARLVSITLRAGNSRAELSARPSSVMWSLESSMNIVPAPVRSLGENHWIVPPSQYLLFLARRRTAARNLERVRHGLHLPALGNVAEGGGDARVLFVAGEAEVDEPLAVEGAGHRLQDPDAPLTVLHQFVVGRQDARDPPLHRQRGERELQPASSTGLCRLSGCAAPPAYATELGIELNM